MRQKTMKKWITGMALACMVLAAGGCSSAEKKEENTLIVGMDDTFAPMGFKNEEGELTGFDIELAEAVSEESGLNFTFQNIDWDLKESELENGNVDLLWNGYSITEKRKEKVLFSDAYMDNSQLIITRKDTGIKEKADLKGKSVAVQKNSSAYEALMKEADVAEQLKGGAPVQFDTNNDCFEDLKAERSDAIVVDETLARYYLKQQKDADRYVVLKDTFGSEQYAIGMRKEDTALCETLNKALGKLKENGRFDELRSKWFEE